MKYILTTIFILFSLVIFGQQNHFIYIQSDNQQAFYVKLDKKIMSSSATGYIIISKLKEGDYNLAIGFPKSEWPEQYITCTVGSTDDGYLLKNFAEKGWGLFNFQTMFLAMSQSKPTTDSSIVKTNTEDAFANALSTVVNDPTIIRKEDIKEDVIPVIADVKSTINKKTISKKEGKGALKTKTKLPVKNTKGTISKLLNAKTADSVNMVYIDKVKGKTDTINVIIPVTDITEMTGIEKDTASNINKTVIPVISLNTDSSIALQKKTDSLTRETISKANSEIVSTPVDTIVNSLPAISNELTIDSASLKTTAKKPAKSNKELVITKAGKKTKSVTKAKAKIMVPEEKNSVVRLNETKAAENSKDSLQQKALQINTTIPNEAVVVNDTTTKEMTNKIEIPTVDSQKIQLPVIEEVKTDLPKNNMAPLKDTVKFISELPIKENPPVIIPPAIKPITTTIVKAIPPVVENNLPVSNNVASMKTNCRVYADDDEYFTLRKKMDKGKKSDKEMLDLAHKVFENRCFNTRQIQRLSLLFMTDAGKYKLFDDAYDYTYDRENFSSLESELKDEYYIKRFRALLR